MFVNPETDGGLARLNEDARDARTKRSGDQIMDADKREHNIQGTPDGDVEADTASGGAPEEPDVTGEKGRPVENPSS